MDFTGLWPDGVFVHSRKYIGFHGFIFMLALFFLFVHGT